VAFSLAACSLARCMNPERSVAADFSRTLYIAVRKLGMAMAAIVTEMAMTITSSSMLNPLATRNVLRVRGAVLRAEMCEDLLNMASVMPQRTEFTVLTNEQNSSRWDWR